MKHTAKELHEQLDESVKRNTELRNEIMRLKRDCGNDTKRLDWLWRDGRILTYLDRASVDAAILETGEQTKEGK